jgi:hypothetical protein
MSCGAGVLDGGQVAGETGDSVQRLLRPVVRRVGESRHTVHSLTTYAVARRKDANRWPLAGWDRLVSVVGRGQSSRGE